MHQWVLLLNEDGLVLLVCIAKKLGPCPGPGHVKPYFGPKNALKCYFCAEESLPNKAKPCINGFN